MKKKDFKKLLLSKRTIANLNGNLMNQIKGGYRDPHDPSDDCGGGTGGTTDTCLSLTDCDTCLTTNIC
jgi:natural product precursor